MVAVVWAEEYVGVMQHTHLTYGLMHPCNSIIKGQKSKQPSSMQQVDKFSFNFADKRSGADNPVLVFRCYIEVGQPRRKQNNMSTNEHSPEKS